MADAPNIVLVHGAWADGSCWSAVIERLQAKDFVERRPAPEDKRIKLLYLTKSGAAILRDIIPAVERAQARMLEPLKPADRKALMGLLEVRGDTDSAGSWRTRLATSRPTRSEERL